MRKRNTIVISSSDDDELCVSISSGSKAKLRSSSTRSKNPGRSIKKPCTPDYRIQLSTRNVNEGLQKVMGIDGVNGLSTYNNDINEMQRALGIETARRTIIDKIEYTMVGHGMSIDTRHMMLLADLMTYKNTTIGRSVDVTQSMRVVLEESEKSSCEYGSYCLWRQEHKEEMHDSTVKKLKDQLFVARAYYPSIAKHPAYDKLSRELKLNIQDLERILSESTTDADRPPMIEIKS